jgi:hypothetical protein
MKAVVRRAGVATLLGFLLVPGLKALGDCASNISSGPRDAPLTGYLTGQRTETVTTQQTYSAGYNRTLSGGYQYQRTVTVAYSVGSYKMSDGTTRQVRCDTYRYV